MNKKEISENLFYSFGCLILTGIGLMVLYKILDYDLAIYFAIPCIVLAFPILVIAEIFNEMSKNPTKLIKGDDK